MQSGGAVYPTPTEVAWAAGLFEGEGCVYNHGKRGFSHLTLSLSSTDRDVIDEFARVVGVGKIYDVQRNEPNRKPIFHWKAAALADVEYALSLIEPLLMSRRRAKVAEVRAAVAANPEPRKAGWPKGKPRK